MDKETFVLVFGLACGVAGYWYGKANRQFPRERWPQWLMAVVCGVLGYAAVTIPLFGLWGAAAAGGLVGMLAGLMITCPLLLFPEHRNLRDFLTTVALMTLLGVISGAFIPFRLGDPI